jgi:hypothetical protein
MVATPIIPKIITFTLQIGAGDVETFAQDVLDAAVVPAPGDVQSVRTLDGVTHQDAQAETWALVLRAIQDWDTTRPGLAHYLFANKGATAAFVLKIYDAAISTSKPALTGNVTLVPFPYGGPGNTFVEAEVSMPLDGDPVVDVTP